MENKVKEISKRKFNVVLGLFLSLFAIFMFINVTVVPRVFTFVFSYGFGFASYLIYILIYLAGMVLIFKSEKKKIKISIFVILGAIFLFIGGLTLATQISFINSKVLINYAEEGSVNVIYLNRKTNNLFDLYNQIFFNFKDGNYLTTSNINLFSNDYSVGCGLSGYFLVALGNLIFNVKDGAIFFAIILLVISLLLFMIPIIIKVSKTKKKKLKKKKEYTEPIEMSDTDMIFPDYSDFSSVGTKSEASHEPITSSESKENPFVASVYTPAMANGTFVKPNFSADLDEKSNDGNLEPIKKENVIIKEEKFDKVEINTTQPTFLDEVNEFISSTNEFGAPIIPDVMNEKITMNEPIKEEPNEPVVAPHVITSTVQQPAVQSQVTKQSEPTNITQTKEPIVWVAPSDELLDVVEDLEQDQRNKDLAEQRKERINEFFKDHQIGARTDSYVVGPSVTRFNISYDSNTTSRSVNTVITDISIRLNGVKSRFTPIVEGLSCSGLEVPNEKITMVSFKEVFTKLPDVNKHPLAIAFGKNIQGDVVWADFDEFPHLLVAGTTGSGKSIFVNSIIATLIMRNSPENLKLVLVDPKNVEMARYNDMPHLLRPIIYEANEAFQVAKKLQDEMERRYKLFKESNGATNLKEYNEDCKLYGGEKLPVIIFVLDEYASLIENCKELSFPIVSLAQKARACGIHLFICTQRPSTNVVTGTIKANVPTHVALLCADSVASQTIIGEGGAEDLLGKGDMLVQSPLISRVGVVRLQGCFASRNEIVRVVKDLKARYKTYYDPTFLNIEEESTNSANGIKSGAEFTMAKEDSEEAKYKAIKEWVMLSDYMSISKIQRECNVGFNRAGRIFIRLQNEGVIASEVEEGNKGCKVLTKGIELNDDTVTSDEVSYIKS